MSWLKHNIQSLVRGIILSLLLINSSTGEQNMSVERLTNSTGGFAGTLDTHTNHDRTTLRQPGGKVVGTIDKNGTVRGPGSEYKGTGGAMLLNLLKK